MKILSTGIVLLVLFVACSKKPAVTPAPTPAPGFNPNANVKYTPEPGDISPEGFNWVHREFALIVSGAIYEHNLKGVVRPERMIQRKGDLLAYLESLRKIQKNDFAKWQKDHQISFLINAYNAHLLLLSIENKFENLSDSLLDKLNTVTLFGKSYSLNGFIRNEIGSVYKDPRIYFVLHCFSASCPEYRNQIVNFKNLEEMLASSTYRFFMDTDKNRFDKKSKQLELSSYVKKYRYIFPSSEKDLQRVLAPYFQFHPEKEVQELLLKGKAKVKFAN